MNVTTGSRRRCSATSAFPRKRPARRPARSTSRSLTRPWNRCVRPRGIPPCAPTASPSPHVPPEEVVTEMNGSETTLPENERAPSSEHLGQSKDSVSSRALASSEDLEAYPLEVEGPSPSASWSSSRRAGVAYAYVSSQTPGNPCASFTPQELGANPTPGQVSGNTTAELRPGYDRHQRSYRSGPRGPNHQGRRGREFLG